MAYGIAGAAVGGTFGLFTSGISNAIAAEREAQARKENYMYGEMAAENADKRTRALYADLQSPKALLEQYREAGLSPSLMFGGQGAGAQPSQGAQGTGANGISPTTYGVSALEAAQIGLMTAQSRKLEEETKTEAGQNDKGKAIIDNLLANTDNTELKNAWQEYSNTLAMLDVTVEASITEDKIKNYKDQCKLLIENLKSAKVKANIDESTYNDVVAYIKQKTLKVAADILLTKANTSLAKSQITLNDTQCQSLLEHIAIDWSKIEIGETENEINRDKLTETVEQWAKENELTRSGQNKELIASLVNSTVRLLAGNAGSEKSGLALLVRILAKLAAK